MRNSWSAAQFSFVPCLGGQGDDSISLADRLRRGTTNVVNVLFVCTLNHARSVQAERLYRGTPGMAVRSAGIAERATHQLTVDDLLWADRVVVFEAAHERWIREQFSGDLSPLDEVGIPDEFAPEDPRLVSELREVLVPLLGPPGRRS